MAVRTVIALVLLAVCAASARRLGRLRQELQEQDAVKDFSTCLTMENAAGFCRPNKGPGICPPSWRHKAQHTGTAADATYDCFKQGYSCCQSQDAAGKCAYAGALRGTCRSACNADEVDASDIYPYDCTQGNVCCTPPKYAGHKLGNGKEGSDCYRLDDPKYRQGICTAKGLCKKFSGDYASLSSDCTTPGMVCCLNHCQDFAPKYQCLAEASCKKDHNRHHADVPGCDADQLCCHMEKGPKDP